MILTFSSESLAQAEADRIHSWMCANVEGYSAGASQWDVPKQAEDGTWSISSSPALDAACDYMWKRIQDERDSRKLNGGYTVSGKWFHSDTFSRTQQLGLVLLGAGIPSGTQWKTMDGSFVTMTQTLAQQIFAAAAQQDIATFAVAENHKAAMQTSVNPSAYDFSVGWPPIFET